MDSKYNETKFKTDLEERVYTSRLLGKEKTLVLHGGGNTSVKTTEKDHTQKEIPTLRVKGNGSDLVSITEKGFTGLRLADLQAASRIDRMSDFQMMDYLRKSMVDPSEPAPSVETFLHAFIPFKFVDHSHSDAIMTLTNSSLSDDQIKGILGNVLIFPYIPPGFHLARKVYDSVSHMEKGIEGIVLSKHGLFTFGETARESYERHVRLVSKAEQFVQAKRKPLDLKYPVSEQDFRSIIPAIRGKLCTNTKKVLITDRSESSILISRSKQAEDFQSFGPATPDMLLRTKYEYCYVESPDIALKRIDEFADRYRKDFAASGIEFPIHDPFPSIIILRGYGILTSGLSRKEARIVFEQFSHSFTVNSDTVCLGKHSFLTKKEAFEIEYWPPEEAKLKRNAPRKLQGQITLVTGSASGIGYETSKKLAENGSVVICCDIDPRVFETAAEISEITKGETFPVNIDISDETMVMDAYSSIVQEFGGIDNVFNNAGILKSAEIDLLDVSTLDAHYRINSRGPFLITREALKIMKLQSTGGNFVFNITKNLLHPGKGMTAYGTSKAFEAQLSHYVAKEGGKYGIRSNIINPDKIFKGSKIWENGVLEARAKAKNQTVEEYKRTNLLGIEVLPEHVANVVIALLDEEAFGATTDAMIPVDGGVS